MLEFKTKLSDNGRLVLPAKCRHALGVVPGEELIILVNNEEARLFSVKHAIQSAQAKVKKHTKGKVKLTDELKKLRREESRNE